MTTTPDDHPDLDTRLSQLALELHGFTPDHTIERIADTARVALTADGAGVIVLRSRRKVEAAATTDPGVERAHALQVELDEGPCLDSGTDDVVRRIDDTALDERWPRWCAEAAHLGYRSVMSAPLATDARRYGSVNVYSARPDAFDRNDEDILQLLARHASVALASATEVEGLHHAIDGRQLIGTAKGILMERYRLDPDHAFEVLKRYSQEQNVKLHEIARRLVEDRRLPTSEDPT